MNENETWGRFKVPEKAEHKNGKLIYRHCLRIRE